MIWAYLACSCVLALILVWRERNEEWVSRLTRGAWNEVVAAWIVFLLLILFAPLVVLWGLLCRRSS